MKQVVVPIVAEATECPRSDCGTKTTDHFICPHCNKGFCGNCFIAVTENEQGNEIKCPECKEKMLLPTNIKA
ncbi:hypothetical protein KKF61_00500 [Patescibacteria group bacterium]|nr:hypothetical protein [Patescibacteria group bacterium]MBU0963484.1 hypothetical protein [Patescibacteria group bacterium]